jgi:hypothetical protein
MNFEELIKTLSKGSATAVTTLESNVAELTALKEYLYVQTPVEQALRASVDWHRNKQRVTFVDYSGDDGDAQVLRRIHVNFANKVRFQLSKTQFNGDNREFEVRRPNGGTI